MTTLEFLNGVSVLEISGRVAGAYCGRLLAGLGAEVTRLDTPLSIYATPGVAAEYEASLNLGKAEIAPEDPIAESLVKSVDVVIVDVLHEDAADGRLTALAQALVLARPAEKPLVDISQFGLWDGGSSTPGSPLLAGAAAAASWSIGDPGREPLSLPFDIPDALAGTEAASAVAVLMLGREPGNRPHTRVEVASTDALYYYINQIGKNFAPVGRPWHRDGPRASLSGGSYPAAIFECSDGAVAIMCRQQREWLAMLAAMGNPEWSQRPEIQDERLVATIHADEVDPKVRAWVGQFSREELFAKGHEFGFPVAAIRTVQETLDDPQYEHRSYWRELPSPATGAAPARVPRIPYRVLATSTRPSSITPRPLGAPGKPLAGLRVLAFTWVWSGPCLGVGLVSLGADVIKVESEGRPDSARARMGALALKRPWVGPRLELAHYFSNLNFGKRSLGIDLTSEEGREILLELATSCDVVIENMRPGTLERRGLGYEQLSERSPGLVMVSMSVAGQDGPLRDIPGYAPVMSGLAGLEALVRYPDSAPMGLFNLAYSDPNAASHGMAALTAALLRQRRTGEGAWIDLSQMEGVSSLMAEPLLEAQLEGAPQAPATSHTSYWPHGHFRCLGQDTWIAVAVRTDAERGRLADLLGVTLDEGLSEALDRWTVSRTRAEAVVSLRAAGVPAAPLRTYEEIQDEQRPATATIVHPYTGEQLVNALPWQIDGVYPKPERRAPLLGEQSDAILRDALGRSDVEIERLRDAGVISPRPEDPDCYPERLGAANTAPPA